MFLLIATGFSGMAILFLSIFYIRYEILSNHWQKDLGYAGSAANAVKHAYAASQLYNTFHLILEPQASEEIVLTLGVFNEYIERITKFSKPDSLRETMKDLYNNLAGITAQEWLEQKHLKEMPADLFLKLADNGALITSRDQNPFYIDENAFENNTVQTANNWLKRHKMQIKKRTNDKLDQIYSPVSRLR